jgi:hypothetical protein
MHDPGCALHGTLKNHSDAARHCSDAVNLHLTAIGFDAVKKWVAVRLSTGKSDGVLYDTKRDAVRHQSDENLCAYVCIPPPGMNPCQAESFMATHRKMYDAGFRVADPDAKHGGKQVIPRLTVEDQAAQMARLK